MMMWPCHATVHDCTAPVCTAGTARLKPPSHDRLRAMAYKLGELVRLLAALDAAAAMPKVQASYGAAVNMLLR